MSDEDLIFLINRGSRAAETVLYQRYSAYSRSMAKRYQTEFSDSGISEDEFYAVAFSKVHESIKKFAELEKVMFVYWKTIAKHAIYDYVNENSYNCGAKQFAGVSFDEYFYNNNVRLLFSDVIGQTEDDEEVKEFLRPYLEGDNDLLTEQEKSIALLRFYDGYSRKEIEELTGLKRSRLDYLLDCATKKLQKLLKENYL